MLGSRFLSAATAAAFLFTNGPACAQPSDHSSPPVFPAAPAPAPPVLSREIAAIASRSLDACDYRRSVYYRGANPKEAVRAATAQILSSMIADLARPATPAAVARELNEKDRYIACAGVPIVPGIDGLVTRHWGGELVAVTSAPDVRNPSVALRAHWEANAAKSLIIQAKLLDLPRGETFVHSTLPAESLRSSTPDFTIPLAQDLCDEMQPLNESYVCIGHPDYLDIIEIDPDGPQHQALIRSGYRLPTGQPS